MTSRWWRKFAYSCRSSLEITIERAGTIIHVPITLQQRDEMFEMAKLSMFLLWGEGALSDSFVSSETGQEEARLRGLLHFQRNQPDVSQDSILATEEKLDELTGSERHHRTVRLGELNRTYRRLTDHIAEVDKDLNRSTDSQQKLALRDRKAELEADREKIVTEMSDIELQLSRYSN